MIKPAACDALTIRHLLQAGGEYLCPHSDSPRADAEVLLMHALKRNRAYLRTWPELEISHAVAESFWSSLERRQRGEPVAYLIQEREFWSRNFRVSPATLIPRPETELLVELALELVKDHSMPEILDLGTGSGIISISLAAECPRGKVTATDISTEALEIARFNAGQHRIANIRFRHGDWFDALSAEQRFDLIVSNPPYIARDDPHLLQGDLRFEPIHALAAGSDGLNALRMIIGQAAKYLKPGGRLMIEHGYNQAESVQTLLLANHFMNIEQHLDLLGHVRVSSASSPCSPIQSGA